MNILLSYSKAHFNPSKKPEEHSYWGSSASILARTLYRLLGKLGEVTYIDKDSEYETVKGKEFDLFIGIAGNFSKILESCTVKKSVYFAVNMHPVARNQRLQTFLEQEQLPLTALSDWDLVETKQTIQALNQADYILCVGNTEIYNSYIQNGIPKTKVLMLNYGLPKEDAPAVKAEKKISKTRHFIYISSDIGLRKGFDIIENLFTSQSLKKQDFHLDIVGITESPFYIQKIKDLVAGLGDRASFHGWVDSSSTAYRDLVKKSDFIIYPSLEEGQAGTVIDATAFGVVPLLTPATGLDFSPLGWLEPKLYSEDNLTILQKALKLSDAEMSRLNKQTSDYYVEFHQEWESRLSQILGRITTGSLYPKASIVLSIFNKEKTIVPLVELLYTAAERYGNAEFEIIFDGCKDKTETLVRHFFQKNAAVPVHFEITPNIFEIKSNNVGLHNASGDYAIIIQDDNFVYDQDFLFEAISFLEKDPTAVILGGLAGVNFYPRGTTGLEGNGQIHMGEDEVYWRQDAATDPALKNRVFQVDACMRGPLFFRKSFLEKHGYLDEIYAPLYQDDMDIAFRARELGYKVYCMLMNVSNSSETMGAYDANKWNYFSQVMKRNTNLFYSRFTPSSDKSTYTWIQRLPFSSQKARPIFTTTSFKLALRTFLQPLNRIGKLFMKALRIFDVRYCEELSDTLWKRRMAWTKEQASLLPAGIDVLDVGAGETLYRESFAHTNYKTQDFSQTPNFTYGKIDVISDIRAIPLPDASFDAIVCTEVFEHIPYPIESLNEISRLLKPGGKLIFSSPLGSGHHQKPYHFYGGYTRFWYEKFFPEAGFHIDTLQPNGGLFGHIVELLWRARSPLLVPLWHKGPFHKLIAMYLQLTLFNFPAVVLWEFERWKVIEDFTVCFFCTATKVGDSILLKERDTIPASLDKKKAK